MLCAQPWGLGAGGRTNERTPHAEFIAVTCAAYLSLLLCCNEHALLSYSVEPRSCLTVPYRPVPARALQKLAKKKLFSSFAHFRLGRGKLRKLRPGPAAALPLRGVDSNSES